MFVLKPTFIGNCDPSKLLCTRLSSSAQDMLFIHYHHFFYGIGINNMSWADELNLVDESLLGSQLPMNIGFKTNIKP